MPAINDDDNDELTSLMLLFDSFDLLQQWWPKSYTRVVCMFCIGTFSRAATRQPSFDV